MSEPIVFISHFRIKEGKLDGLQALSREGVERIRAQKPRTLLFLSFVDEDRRVISFLHAFADADSMDAHVEGADERARVAYELMEPMGWEVYGRPSAPALDSMRQGAATAGVELTVYPDYVGGFLRLQSE